MNYQSTEPTYLKRKIFELVSFPNPVTNFNKKCYAAHPYRTDQTSTLDDYLIENLRLPPGVVSVQVKRFLAFCRRV